MMPQRLQFEALLGIWEELLMKFPTQIYQVTPNIETCAVIIKIRDVSREIRDQLILRRFCSMAGVEVGFYQPRRMKPPNQHVHKRDIPYKVWVTVHLEKTTYFDSFPLRVEKKSDISAEEFEKWLDRARSLQKAQQARQARGGY